MREPRGAQSRVQSAKHEQGSPLFGTDFPQLAPPQTNGRRQCVRSSGSLVGCPALGGPFWAGTSQRPERPALRDPILGRRLRCNERPSPAQEAAGAPSPFFCDASPLGVRSKSASRDFSIQTRLAAPTRLFFARAKYLSSFTLCIFFEKVFSCLVSLPQTFPPPALFRAFRTVDPRPGELAILLHRHQTLPLSVVRAWHPYRRRFAQRYDTTHHERSETS